MTLRAGSLIVLLLALIPDRITSGAGCTRCALKLLGDGANGTISVASLSCTAGPNLAAAAADPQLLSRMHGVGVDWKAPSTCNSSPSTCLLSVCGGADVTFEGANLKGLNITTGHVLCLAANSTVTIVNSQLVSNAAAMIYAKDASLRLINTTIKDNACSQPGQGMTGLTMEGTSLLHIEGSNFVNNSHAMRGGPALVIDDNTTANITSTNFSDNRAKCPASHITACRFTRNINPWVAGALQVSNFAHVVISATSFTNNTSLRSHPTYPPGSGGALSIHQNATVVIQNSRFKLNLADNGGAVAIRQGRPIFIKGCSFSGNKGSASGGGVWASQARMYITSGKFSANMAGSGGAIYLTNASRLTMSRVDLVDNAARDEGGALTARHASRVRTHDIGVVLYNNSAMRGGAVMLTTAARLHADDCLFEGNTAFDKAAMQPGAGGAVFLDNSAVVAFTNSTLSNNRAGYGGAVYAASPSRGNPSAASSANDSDASYIGGAANLAESTVITEVHMLTADLHNNSATDQGGAVSLVAAHMNAVDCWFQNNTAGIVSDEATQNGEGWGGVLNLQEAAAVTLRNSTLADNNAGHGGAIYARDTSRVNISSAVHLFENKASRGGGAVLLSGSSAVRLSDGVFFKHNLAEFGGGIAMYGDSALVLGPEVHVTGNEASKSGGGIFLGGASRITWIQPGAISRALINGNKAGEAGGGLFLFSEDFLWQSVIAAASNNTAPYAADYYIPAKRLQLVNGTTPLDLISRLDGSSVQVTVNATGSRGAPSSLDVQASLQGVPIASQKTADTTGLATFKVAVRKPPGQYDLDFTSVMVHGNRTVVTVTMPLNVLGCPKGDVVASTGDACITCVAGSYSFDPHNTTCDKCPDNAVCPGSWAVLPLKGCWSSSPYSTQIHRCRNPEACPGNNSNSCAQGYTSNLCGECEANWGSPRPFVCSQCWASGKIITLYVLAALAMLLYAKVLCHFSLADTTTTRTAAGLGHAQLCAPQAEPLEGPSVVRVNQQQQPRSTAVCVTDIMHVFMFYLQCMWILSSIDVRYPASLSAPFNALQWLFSAASPRALGIDCILRSCGHMTVAAQEFVLSMVMPLAIMLVLIAYEILVGFAKLSRRNHPGAAVREQLHKLTATSIIVLITFLPQLLRAVFGLFACVPLDNPVSAPYEAEAVGTFWVSQMSQQCWHGFHRVLALGAGIPLVLLLCIVWPTSILVFMLRHRGGSLYSSELRHYSFLYSLYKPSTAWWEVVMIVQQSVLVAITVFAVRLGTYFGCVMLHTVYFLVFLLLVWLRPYNSACTAAVARRGALCVFVTSLSTLLFMPAGTISGHTSACEQYAVAVGVVVLCINIAFVVSVAWQLVRVVKWTALAGKVKGVIGKITAVVCQMLGVRKHAVRAAGVPAASFKDPGIV